MCSLEATTAAEAALSSVNPATGVITIYFNMVVGGAIRTYKSVYTPI